MLAFVISEDMKTLYVSKEDRIFHLVWLSTSISLSLSSQGSLTFVAYFVLLLLLLLLFQVGGSVRSHCSILASSKSNRPCS